MEVAGAHYHARCSPKAAMCARCNTIIEGKKRKKKKKKEREKRKEKREKSEVSDPLSFVWSEDHVMLGTSHFHGRCCVCAQCGLPADAEGMVVLGERAVHVRCSAGSAAE